MGGDRERKVPTIIIRGLANWFTQGTTSLTRLNSFDSWLLGGIGGFLTRSRVASGRASPRYLDNGDSGGWGAGVKNVL